MSRIAKTIILMLVCAIAYAIGTTTPDSTGSQSREPAHACQLSDAICYSTPNVDKKDPHPSASGLSTIETTASQTINVHSQRLSPGTGLGNYRLQQAARLALYRLVTRHGAFSECADPYVTRNHDSACGYYIYALRRILI